MVLLREHFDRCETLLSQLIQGMDMIIMPGFHLYHIDTCAGNAKEGR